ncbi:collagen alpha-1(I) chain-like [Cervus canadensis]|uniref:collagen alpha-1(I) chain-like n=1 Tax=Cervus canadensis TaxID=1574408 RepID=UPI001C9E79F3|nr:collagen alpha-1(I) chain-like [Cervus canadensis]
MDVIAALIGRRWGPPRPLPRAPRLGDAAARGPAPRDGAAGLRGRGGAGVLRAERAGRGPAPPQTAGQLEHPGLASPVPGEDVTGVPRDREIPLEPRFRRNILETTFPRGPCDADFFLLYSYGGWGEDEVPSSLSVLGGGLGRLCPGRARPPGVKENIPRCGGGGSEPPPGRPLYTEAPGKCSKLKSSPSKFNLRELEPPRPSGVAGAVEILEGSGGTRLELSQLLRLASRIPRHHRGLMAFAIQWSYAYIVCSSPCAEK